MSGPVDILTYTVLSMTQRTIFACLIVIFLLVGCNNDSEVAEPTSPVESQGDGITGIPGSWPLPDAGELEALGPLNDLDTQWLLSDSVFVAAGQPRRFLASPLGRENAEIINGTLLNFLQIPLEFNDVDRFVFGMPHPVEIISEVVERGVKVPRPALLYRRATVLTFAAPIQPEDLLKRLFSTPKQFTEIPRRKIGNRDVFDLTPPNLAIPQKFVLFFADDKTVVLVEGDEPAIQEAFNDKPPRGAAVERIRRTDIVNNDFVLVASREGVPFSDTELQFMLQQSGVPDGIAGVLATGLRAVAIRANVQAEVGKPMFVAALEMTTPKVAEEISETFLGYLMTAQTGLMSMNDGNKNLLPIPADFASSLLNSLTIEAEGCRIDTTLTKFADFDAVAAKGITDAQARIQEQQKQQQRFEQLALLASAFVAYHQRNQKFPTAIFAEDGTPLLSWRVGLLPTIGLEVLYRKFKLDEPWDSPTNKPLLDEMPSIFAASEPSVEKNKTILRYFDSEGTPFADREIKAEKLQTPQSTLLLVSVVPEKAVEWTKPDPLEFDVPQIEETVGNVLFGVSFVGQPVIIPIVPLSDPQSGFQREVITAIVKGQPLPQSPPMPPSPMPTPVKEEAPTEPPTEP